MIQIEGNKCDFCGCCVGVCPVDCIEVMESSIEIVDDICIDCATQTTIEYVDASSNTIQYHQ